MNTFVYFFLSIFLTYLFLQIFRNPTHKSHAKSFLQRLRALLKRSLYATQFRRVCLYLNEEMRPLCHNADQLRASLCLMELIKVKRLKGFLFVIFLFGSFFFFRHIKAALTFILHHWRRFWIRIFFDKTRGSLVLRFLKLSLVQYMYCISGTLSSSGDHCAP